MISIRRQFLYPEAGKFTLLISPLRILRFSAEENSLVIYYFHNSEIISEESYDYLMVINEADISEYFHKIRYVGTQLLTGTGQSSDCAFHLFYLQDD